MRIVTEYDDFKNEIGLLRGQIKILQNKLEDKMEDQEVIAHQKVFAKSSSSHN